MKKKNSLDIMLAMTMLAFMGYACSPKSTTEADVDGQQPTRYIHERALSLFDLQEGDSLPSDFIQMSLEEVSLSFQIPAIQSPVFAAYDGKWILFGGRKSGLHNMNNDPPAFSNNMVNDSIWVIDMYNQYSQRVAVPAQYFKYFSASSQQFFQDGEQLYVVGGFTFADSSSKVSNWTSDYFHEINLPNLIQYVETQGASPSLDQVVTKEISDPFLQVTGGEMIVSNGNFYLVGGHNYQGAYLPGNNGAYTSAVRKFSLSMSGNSWVISDTLSIKDTVNLHRRDYNLAEVITPNFDSLGAVVYGGVFTKDGLGYRSPVYLNGLGRGTPYMTVDQATLQKVNLYSAAKVNAIMAIGDYRVGRISLLGGITYMAYDQNAGGLVVPSDVNALPFSNLISTYYTNGEDETIELVQTPPNNLMPGYLGTNAVFFPISSLLYGSSTSIIDLNKVFPDGVTGPVLVGYMYGGIVSPVPNTTTPTGNYTTTNSRKLYGVYMTLVVF